MNAAHLKPDQLSGLQQRGSAVPVPNHRLIHAEDPSKSWGKTTTGERKGPRTIALHYSHLIEVLRAQLDHQVEIVPADCLQSRETDTIVEITLTNGRKITAKYMIDASGSTSSVSRNHITQEGVTLLQDDPFVCWVHGIRARGEFIPSVLCDPISLKIGVGSWILPYSDTYGDIVAADYCRISELSQVDKEGTLQRLLAFCEAQHLCHVDKTESIISGIIRSQPMKAKDAKKTNKVYPIGAAAGMGSPLMAEVIPPTLRWASELATAIAEGKSPASFHRLWRHKKPMFPYDIEIAMLLRRVAYRKQGICGSNAPVYKAILGLPEEAQQHLLHNRTLPKKYWPTAAVSILSNPKLATSMAELFYYLAKAELLYQ